MDEKKADWGSLALDQHELTEAEQDFAKVKSMLPAEGAMIPEDRDYALITLLRELRRNLRHQMDHEEKERDGLKVIRDAKMAQLQIKHRVNALKRQLNLMLQVEGGDSIESL